MKKKAIITMMFALVAMTGQAQEERIDTVIPKYFSNGYFFREMSKELPGNKFTMMGLNDAQMDTGR